ncbi:hypothetical protein ACFL96_12880 [Thermoproteota archaeon]
MKQLELERIFLAKELPQDLKNPVLIKVGDFHDSDRVDSLKIKQKGDMCFLIKKEGDGGKRMEHIIPITQGEFDVIYPSATIKHSKKRYMYPLGKRICEIDIYDDGLFGYVRLEVEFDNENDMNGFEPPQWFGEEITHLNHIIHAGLGTVTFAEMKRRYMEEGIDLNIIG